MMHNYKWVHETHCVEDLYFDKYTGLFAKKELYNPYVINALV